jgi:hypothetical protein
MVLARIQFHCFPDEHFVWHDYLESTHTDEVPQMAFLHVSFIELLTLHCFMLCYWH